MSGWGVFRVADCVKQGSRLPCHLMQYELRNTSSEFPLEAPRALCYVPLDEQLNERTPCLKPSWIPAKFAGLPKS
jgi:hypothetical protein